MSLFSFNPPDVIIEWLHDKDRLSTPTGYLSLSSSKTGFQTSGSESLVKIKSRITSFTTAELHFELHYVSEFS